MSKNLLLLVVITVVGVVMLIHPLHSDQPKIIVVLKTLSSEYWKNVEKGAQQAFKDYGINGVVLGPASEINILEQVHLVEDVINMNPQALIIAPIIPHTVSSVLSRDRNFCFPVLFLDTDAPYKEKRAFVGIDNRSAGRIGGETLARHLSQRDPVVLISGVQGNMATDERIAGAKEALQAANLKVIAIQSAASDKVKGMSVMEDILQSHPHVQGVYAANDEMAMGALRAVRERGKRVAIVGTDGTLEARKSVESGGLLATVAQNPYTMGYMAVEGAVKCLRNESTATWIDSGVELISQ